MAGVGAWNVPAGTASKLKVRRKDWKVTGGAVEHKNRPEALYATIASWVKPKLSMVTARATSTSDPEDLARQTSIDFGKEIERAAKRFSSFFDPKFFDPNSIIWTIDYAAGGGKVGLRQFLEIEINIDTVNTIGRDDQPSPNPSSGKVEMYSYKDLESHLTKAIDKILSMEAFDDGKSLVSFGADKGAK